MSICRIVIFALIVGSCLAENSMKVPKNNTSSKLIGATIKILKTCYGHRLDAVRLTGKLDGTYLTLLFEQSIPVMLINNTIIHRRGLQKAVRNLQVFVVAASSPTKLTAIVNGLKDSIWWNHLAYFIILSWSSKSDHACSNAYEFLWAAWKLDLLKTKLLCLDRANGEMIYGFNPFTKKAPYPWELKKTYNGKNNHPWTLFARRFQGDQKICEQIDFDKTKDLGGYEVRAIVWRLPGFFSIDYNKTGTDRFEGVSGNVVKIIYQSLNATCNVIDPNMTDFELINRLVFKDHSDIVIFPRYQSFTINFTTTYPYWQSGLGIMTQYSGKMSQLDKLVSVIDRTSRCAVCIVLFITLLFFKFSLRQYLMSGILNILRVIFGQSVLNAPQNHAARIYLASVFLFALTLRGIYDGQLASLLTKSVPLPNVNTLADLANSHHAIYSYRVIGNFFEDSPLLKRFVELKPKETCYEVVQRNSSVACITDRFLIMEEVIETNIYMSSDNVKKGYWVYPIRKNWPLEERFNIILQRLVEADLVNYWHNKWTQKSIDQNRYYAKHENHQHFKNITLDELSFAFAMLGIGLSFASVVFFFEFRINLACMKSVVWHH